MFHNLTKAVKTIPLSVAIAGGTTAITTVPTVDALGYAAVRFLVYFGVIDSSAVTSVKVQQSDDDAVADAYSDLAGSLVTVTDANDGKLAIIDVYRPLKRWLKVYISRGTANAAIVAIVAELYHAEHVPVTQDTGVLTPVVLNSPAEGTA